MGQALFRGGGGISGVVAGTARIQGNRVSNAVSASGSRDERRRDCLYRADSPPPPKKGLPHFPSLGAPSKPGLLMCKIRCL
jgi:hypothetical protein